ncbi:MAG: hypothetical protein U0791_12940 [Gemmataceae bacterium]
MFRTLAAVALLFALASLASADPGPTLLTVFPPGVKAGETVEVTLVGTGFDGDEKLLFSDPKVKGELVPGATVPPKKGGQPGQAPPTTAKFKVTAPKDAEGIVDVRLVCQGGLTNPRAFVVGTLNEVNEKEPNNDVPEAQSLPVDSTISGTIGANTDVDYFLVKAKAKQSLVVYCLTTTLDSKMQAEVTVIAPDGRTVAANRGYRDGDAVLDFTPATDGDYLIRVSQFAYTTGGPDHFYRLTVSTGAWVDAAFPPLTATPGKADWALAVRNGKTSMPPFSSKGFVFRSMLPSAGMLDVQDRFAGTDGNLLLAAQSNVILDSEKNHTAATAQSITVPCDVAGRIEKKGARHWYGFNAKKGDVWTLEVFADRIGSPVDAYYQLMDEKGKLIVEQDDGPDTLSPNQLYTKSDDPGRYRFSVPADGTYKVMVSTREAAVQFGVRDQYVLRIAKEKPDFRLAVMPAGTHYLDAGTLPKGGAAMFNVYVWRMDGFTGPITLGATNLPKGVTCPPQTIGANQVRGTLVLTAASDAADWAGSVNIVGRANLPDGEFETAARPFSVVWPIPNLGSGAPAPNTPMITRMDRGGGLALAVRGEAPFSLAIVEKGPIPVPPGGKVAVTVKVKRDAKFKDAVQVYASNGFGPRQQGGQPAPVAGTIPADKDEVKLTLDLPQNVQPGSHTLVLRGVAGAAAPKGGNNNARVPVSYPALPVAVEIEGRKKP